MPAGEADRLREYLHGEYLILYTVATPGLALFEELARRAGEWNSAR